MGIVSTKSKTAPTFLIIGPGKTATTWLKNAIGEHPEAYIYHSEIDFFSFNFDKGVKWYENHFSRDSNIDVVGEKSPSYLTYAPPERIYKYNPDIKLITIVRHPIERAYSNYCMFLKEGVVGNNPDSEIKLGTKLVDEGFYYKNISEYLEFFSEDQIKIAFFEDLKYDQKNFLKSIFNFLDISPDFKPKILNQKYNSRKKRPRHKKIFNLLTTITSVLKKFKYTRGMVEYIRKGKINDYFWELMGGNEKYPSMSEQKIEELLALYKQDIRSLEELTGRNLEHWLKYNS